MNEDWRLEVDFGSRGEARAMTGRLAAGEVRHDLRRDFGESVIVSLDHSKIFVYAASREQLEKAGDAIAGDAEQHGWQPTFSLKRWHPIEELWEDPDKPLPSSEDARRSERRSLMARERAAVELTGYPEYEVRVELSSHRDASDLARCLENDSLQPVRRWKYIVVGATDEDDARALADQIRKNAPRGTRITVEGTRAAIEHNFSHPMVIT